MKKIILILALGLSLSANEVYKMGEGTLIKSTFRNTTYIDYCIGNYVWRSLIGGYRGSLSQIFVQSTNSDRHSIPVKCSEYKELKNKGEI